MPSEIDRLRESIERLTSRLDQHGQNQSQGQGHGGGSGNLGTAVAASASSGFVDAAILGRAVQTLATTLEQSGRLVNTTLTTSIGSLDTNLKTVTRLMILAFDEAIVSVKEFASIMGAHARVQPLSGSHRQVAEQRAHQDTVLGAAYTHLDEQHTRWKEFKNTEVFKRFDDTRKQEAARSAATAQAPAPPSQAPAKTGNLFGAMNSKMIEFIGSLGVVGAVLRGLSGTREGFFLNYSMNHIFFEIADMLRGPVRFITNELEGFAQVLHALNRSNDGNKIFNPQKIVQQAQDQEQANINFNAREADVGSRNHDDKLYQLGLKGLQRQSERLGKEIEADKQKNGDWAVDIGFGGIRWHNDNPEMQDKKNKKARIDSEIETAQQQHQKFAAQPAQHEKVGPVHVVGGKEADDHLMPMLTASFGAVADLQNKMQQLATENPAQTRGLSLVENCYNTLVKIFNKMGGAQLDEIPDPSNVNGTKKD